MPEHKGNKWHTSENYYKPNPQHQVHQLSTIHQSPPARHDETFKVTLITDRRESQIIAYIIALLAEPKRILVSRGARQETVYSHPPSSFARGPRKPQVGQGQVKVASP